MEEHLYDNLPLVNALRAKLSELIDDIYAVTALVDADGDWMPHLDLAEDHADEARAMLEATDES